MSTKTHDGIVIYSTEGNIMFSSTGEIIQDKKPPRKHRIQKNIVNDIFEKLRKHNTESFWDNILMKFSRNIFPKDFRFHNSILYYKIKAKKFKDEIFIDDDTEENFIKLQIFLRDKGIIPVGEINSNKDDISVKRSPIKNWKDAGKNKIILLYDYINKLTSKYELDAKEKLYLESLTKMTLYNDVIGNDNIIMKDECIEDIKHLKWNENTRRFYVDMDKITIKINKTEKKNTEKYYTLSSFSDENNIIATKEIEINNIEKKWDNFLNLFYNKNV